MLAAEVRAEIRAAIDALPDRQRIVITLRDVMGHSSDEVCQMLEISAANQRVLLHRARAAVRAQPGAVPRDGSGHRHRTGWADMADLTCRDFVELVTDYLEGALDEDTRTGSSSTWPSARAARPTCNR